MLPVISVKNTFPRKGIKWLHWSRHSPVGDCYPVQTCELARPERYADLRSDAACLITRGSGDASYGDAALNENGAGVVDRAR